MPIVLFADTLDEICSYKRAKELEKTLGEVVVDFVTSSAAGHDTFLGNNDQSFISLVISHLSPVSANPGTQKKTACKTQEGGRRNEVSGNIMNDKTGDWECQRQLFAFKSVTISIATAFATASLILY